MSKLLYLILMISFFLACLCSLYLGFVELGKAVSSIPLIITCAVGGIAAFEFGVYYFLRFSDYDVMETQKE